MNTPESGITHYYNKTIEVLLSLEDLNQRIIKIKDILLKLDIDEELRTEILCI